MFKKLLNALTFVFVAASFYNAQTVIGSGFSSSRSVFVSGNGDIYVADTGNGAIKKMNSTGGNIVTLATGINTPFDIVLDAAGNIFVTEFGSSGTVIKMDADGGNKTTLASGLNYPVGLALDNNGRIYVTELYGKTLKRMDANGANITTLATGFQDILYVKLDASGNIYVSDFSGGVIKMDSSGGNRTILGTGIQNPRGLAIGSDGNVYLMEWNGALKRMNTSGGNVTTLATGFSDPFQIAFNNNGDLYLAENGRSNIVKIEASTLETSNFVKKAFSMYPNPAKDFVVLTGLVKDTEVSLLDTTGKLLFRTKATGNSLTLSTVSYTNGLYWVKANGQTSQLIIAK